MTSGGVTINSLSSIRRQADTVVHSLNACPITYPEQRVPLPDLGIHAASGAWLQHDGGRLVRFKLLEGRTIRVLFHARGVQKPMLSFGCLAQQGCWSDLRAETVTPFFPDKIQTHHSQTQLHKEESLFFVEGMLMAPLVTAGVSDEVPRELLMPTGPQALEDVEERCNLVLQYSKIQAQLIISCRRDTLSEEHLVGKAAGVVRSRAVRCLQEPAR